MTIYRVKRGDTLSKIADAFELPLSKLEADNGFPSDRPLIPGEELTIVKPTESYTVKAGDSLYSIADSEGSTVRALLRENPQLEGNPLLYEGQTLTLRGEGRPERPMIVNGYAYPFIEERVLRTVLPYLTYLTVFTYGFTEEGRLIVPDDTRMLELADSYGVDALLLVSTLGEDGTFNNELSSRMFRNQEVKTRLINELVTTAKSKGYRGVEVDFEFLGRENAEEYVAFLAELAQALRQNDLLLFVALAPKISDDQPGDLYEGHDYFGIGQIADYVILMTYEWGYQYGPPGAIAPISNVEAVVQYAVGEIAPEKILLGIPNYGYDWPLPYVKGETAAEGISQERALARAAEVGAEILFDETAGAPYYNYLRDGVQHVVWFENASSVASKLALVEEYDLAGISIWNIMRYFPQLYRLINEGFLIDG